MSNKIFITGLPKTIQETDIREVFGRFGKIRLVFIHGENAKETTSCFVVFSTPDEAHEAIHTLSYSEFVKQNEKTTIKITYGDEKTLSLIKSGENRLLIEGLDSNVTESSVYDAFNHFGEVIYCTMPVTITKKTIGTCLVTYRTKEEADNAIEHMNNSTVNGKSITVRFAPKF